MGEGLGGGMRIERVSFCRKSELNSPSKFRLARIVV